LLIATFFVHTKFQIKSELRIAKHVASGISKVYIIDSSTTKGNNKMETYYILATSRGYNLTLQVVQGVPAALESVSYWKNLGYSARAWDEESVPAWAIEDLRIQNERKAQREARDAAMRRWEEAMLRWNAA
jgi:hypothetical protein